MMWIGDKVLKCFVLNCLISKWERGWQIPLAYVWLKAQIQKLCPYSWNYYQFQGVVSKEKKGSRQLCGWWCRTPTRHRRKKTLKKLRDLPIGILEILIMPTQVRVQTFVRSASAQHYSSLFCWEIYSMINHDVDQCPLPLANLGAVFKDSSSRYVKPW